MTPRQTVQAVKTPWEGAGLSHINRRDYMIFVWHYSDSLRAGNITVHTVHLVQTDSHTTTQVRQGHISELQVRILLTQWR
jgi:hypothetical protein